MAIVDCTCRGINQDCGKCFGRGYYDSDELLRSTQRKLTKITGTADHNQPNKSFFIEEVENYSKEKIILAIEDIITKIDSISAIQKHELLCTKFVRSIIPRMPPKIRIINSLETQKKELKEKLNVVINKAILLNIQTEVNFSELLSTIDIDTLLIEDFKHLQEKLAKNKKSIRDNRNETVN